MNILNSQRKTRVFATQIAQGFSSEARVFASLLRETTSLETLVVHQSDGPVSGGPLPFEEASGISGTRIDTGWRGGKPGHRHSPPYKALLLTKFATALVQMERVARQFKPDVVYSSQQKWDCTAASYIAQRLGVPQVVHLHYRVGPWLGWLPNRRLKACAKVIAVSEFIYNQASDSGIERQKVVSIRNSVSANSNSSPSMREKARQLIGLPVDSVVAGMFARMDPGKGQGDVLQAFEAMAAGVPGAHLVFAGAGVDEERLHSTLATSRFSTRVKFLGHRSDIPYLLNALDFVVHPSEKDPCPLAVLEAQAAGLPVVAYESGGVPELVDNGRTGLLSDTGDLKKLSENMHCMFTNVGVRLEMGRSAKKRIEELFRPEDAGHQFEEAILSVAQTR